MYQTKRTKPNLPNLPNQTCQTYQNNQPTLTDDWKLSLTLFIQCHKEDNKNKNKNNSHQKNQLLHIGSSNLVYEQNFAQLEAIWSKNLLLTLSERATQLM